MPRRAMLYCLLFSPRHYRRDAVAATRVIYAATRRCLSQHARRHVMMMPCFADGGAMLMLRCRLCKMPLLMSFMMPLMLPP